MSGRKELLAMILSYDALCRDAIAKGATANGAVPDSCP